MKRRHALALLPALGLLIAARPAKNSSAGLDTERLALIPVRLQTLVNRKELAGAVTLVARHGATVQQSAVGFADLENRRPMRPDTIFQIMSMTKPVTAIGVMMLVEEGKLSLLDPVERHLPEFRGQVVAEADPETGAKTYHAPTQPITVRDLLTHTSGMPDDPNSKLNQKMDLTLETAVRGFARQPLAFEPGTRWQYSNAGIATLGRLIEVAADQPYEKFIADRILTPLGMSDTHFFLPPAKRDRLALVYRVGGGQITRVGGDVLGGDPAQFRREAKYPAPEWGLYSTAPDLLRFYQMMLDGGVSGGRRYLTRVSVDLMREVHTGEIKVGRTGWLGGSGYGLAWEVVDGPRGELIYHSRGTYGHGGAFGTQGWIDPVQGMVKILLIQKVGGDDTARNVLMSLVGAALG